MDSIDFFCLLTTLILWLYLCPKIMADRWTGGLEYVKEFGKQVVTDVLSPPVKLHIDYWCCCSGNVQCLDDEVRGLEREMNNMKQQIEVGRFRADRATDEVRNWLDAGAPMLEEARIISQRGRELKPWNIRQRYLVGKNAKKTADRIAKHRNERNSVIITCPPPPPSMGSLSFEQTMHFESRRHIEEGVMGYLKDNNVRIVAICGARGVGKTIMKQRIEERVRRENLFDEIVRVVVNQQIDKLEIQQEIAEMLGLPLSEQTLTGRAHKIRTRLRDERSKLIIFEDVRESFELKDIGVPFECKVILTSQSRYVCQRMEANKFVKIEVLDEEEAWKLFEAKCGHRLHDDSDLHRIAEAIVAESRGLPITLVNAGTDLKSKSIHCWRDYLSELRRANAPTN